MILQSLRIEPRQSYSPPSKDNPYEAKLTVSHSQNTMQVVLGPETCAKIIALAGDEIAKAASIQIRDFVQAALVSYKRL